MKRSTLQKLALTFVLPVGLAAFTSPAFSQSPDLQAKVAALKQSVSQNQMALHQYTWTETTQMLLKGDTKSTKMSQCSYGPDGTVQKTPIGPPPPPPQQQRGIRGRIVEKKTDEITGYMQRVSSLITRYTPPSAATMQSSLAAGNASFTPVGGGIITVTFKNYALPGDSVALTFDTGSNRVLSYAVNTYLDQPSDVVTLKVGFDNLPGGPNYVSQTVLDATAEQVQIRTTSTNYMKM